MFFCIVCLCSLLFLMHLLASLQFIHHMIVLLCKQSNRSMGHVNIHLFEQFHFTLCQSYILSFFFFFSLTHYCIHSTINQNMHYSIYFKNFKSFLLIVSMFFISKCLCRLRLSPPPKISPFGPYHHDLQTLTADGWL